MKITHVIEIPEKQFKATITTTDNSISIGALYREIARSNGVTYRNGKPTAKTEHLLPTVYTVDGDGGVVDSTI